MKKKRFADGGKTEDDAEGIPDYAIVNGKRMSGDEHRTMQRRQADEKAVAEAEEASKFSSKAKAAASDVLSGIGSVLHSKAVKPTSEFYRLRETEHLGDEAKKRLDSGKKKGRVIKMAKGGSASSRADGCAIRGKTRA